MRDNTAHIGHATSVRLQIFLDNHNFGPGKIDGEMGEFFRKALLAYKRANGMPTNGSVDQSLLDEVPQPYTTWTIPPEAENFVGPAPTQPAEQAKLKALKYGSLLELICERFHAAEAFIRKINPGMKLDQLKPGDTVRVPNVNEFKIEDLHEGFMPDKPEFAHRRLVVDTHERFLEIHDGDKLVAEFPITPGSSSLYKLSPDDGLVKMFDGLTAVISLTFMDGKLYALETSTAADNPVKRSGKIVRVSYSGEITEVLTGLSFPTAITAGPDGALYVSEFGYGEDPKAGRILRVRLK